MHLLCTQVIKPKRHGVLEKKDCVNHSLEPIRRKHRVGISFDKMKCYGKGEEGEALEQTVKKTTTNKKRFEVLK